MPTDLQALVGAPAWRWMGGMWWDARLGGTCPLCNGDGGFRWREADGSENGEECPCAGRVELYPTFRNEGLDAKMRACGVRPDLTDPATRGCMLALAREAWADPTLHLQPFEADYCGEPRILWVLASKPIGENLRYLSVDDGLEADGSLTREWVDHIVRATWFRADGDALAAAIIAAPA